MRKVIGVFSWPLVILAKFALFLVGIFAVAVMVRLKKEWKPWRRELPSRPYTYWEMAWRNPVGGFAYLLEHPPIFRQKTRAHGIVTLHLEKLDEYQEELVAYPEPWTLVKLGSRTGWRWRWSGYLVSFRLVRLTRNRERYRELYIGWKLGSEPPLLDFASSVRGLFRPRKVGK